MTTFTTQLEIKREVGYDIISIYDNWWYNNNHDTQWHLEKLDIDSGPIGVDNQCLGLNLNKI